MKDEDPYWLEPSFNPNKATRLDLRRWLSMYDTPLPSIDLKKDVLVALFQQHIGSKREQLLRKFHTPVISIESSPSPPFIPSTPGPSREPITKGKSTNIVSTDEDENEEIMPLPDILATIESLNKVPSTPSLPSSNSGSERTTPRAHIKPTPSPSPHFYSTRSSQSSDTSQSSSSPGSPTPPASSATPFVDVRSTRPSPPVSRITKPTVTPSPSPFNRKSVYFTTRSRPLEEGPPNETASEKRSSPETTSGSSTASSLSTPSTSPQKHKERRNLFTYPPHTKEQAKRNSKNFFNLSALHDSRSSQNPSALRQEENGYSTRRPSFFRAPTIPILWSKTYDFLFWCGKVGFLFLLAMMVLIYFHSRNAIGYCDQPSKPFSDESISSPTQIASSPFPIPPSDTPSLVEEKNRTIYLHTPTSPWLHHLWTMLFPSCTPCPLHAHCAHGRAVSCPEHYVLKQVLWNRWHCAPDTERRKNIDLLLDHLVAYLQVEAGQRICEDTSEWFSYAQVQQFSQHLSQKLWRGKKDATLYHAIVIGELFTQPIESIVVNNTLITARYPTLPWRCSLRRLLHSHGPHLLAILVSILTTTFLYFRHQQQKNQQRLVDHIVHHIVDLLVTQDRLHQEDPSRPSFLGIAAIKLQVHAAYAHEAGHFDSIWQHIQTQLSVNPNVRWRTTKYKGEMVESWEWIGFDSLVTSPFSHLRTKRGSKRSPVGDFVAEDAMEKETWKDGVDIPHPKRSSTI